MRRIPIRKFKANSYSPKRDTVRIRLGFYQTISAYRNPSVRPLGPASSPFRGAFGCGSHGKAFSGEAIHITSTILTVLGAVGSIASIVSLVLYLYDKKK